MTFDWFMIFNLDVFNATELVSRDYTNILDVYGSKTVTATKGDYVSVLFDDVFLPINLNSKNPFIFESRAVYLDASNNVWVGIET